MNTEKLYDKDPYLTQFTAQVLSCTPEKEGYAVVLDRTAFYPEGGGQGWDVGTLGQAKVFAVTCREDTVIHHCSAPLTGQVAGKIDWPRRFDFMQQHSGEHLVSGCVHRLLGLDNVGFHLGADVVTIDFNGPISPQALEQIEREANQAVWANRETQILLPTPEQLPQLTYRSKKALTGQVRIVRFPGVDDCACCGTHVARTGEIGLVKLLSCVKFRSGVRLEMICGQRAYEYLAQIYGQNQTVSGLLSVPPLSTGQGAAQLCQRLSQAKQNAALWQRRCFSAVAQGLRGKENVLVLTEQCEHLHLLAQAVQEACGGRCAVFAQGDNGWRYAIAQAEGDLRPLARQLGDALGGRGGGKPQLIQGAVSAEEAKILHFFAGDTLARL